MPVEYIRRGGVVFNQRNIFRENPVERIGYQKDGIKDIQKHQ